MSILLNDEEIQYEIDYVLEHNDLPLEVTVKALCHSVKKAQLKKVGDIIKRDYPETEFLLEDLPFWQELLKECNG